MAVKWYRRGFGGISFEIAQAPARLLSPNGIVALKREKRIVMTCPGMSCGT